MLVSLIPHSESDLKLEEEPRTPKSHYIRLLPQHIKGKTNPAAPELLINSTTTYQCKD